MLDVLEREFVVPVIFPTRGALRKKVGDLAAGTEFAMDAFVIGNGRLVAIYPHPIEVHRDDPPFDLFSGNYSFFAINVAEIVFKKPDRIILDGLRGRDQGGERYGALGAPLNCKLEGLELTRGEDDVSVDIHCWPWAPDWKIRHPLFERRSSPSAAR